MRTYDIIKQIATDQKDDCTTGCLLDYLYLKKKLQGHCDRYEEIKSS